MLPADNWTKLALSRSYLYYALRGEDRGLYRVDLDTIHPSGGAKVIHIVNIDDLSAFVVDFDNVQLYFPNNSMDTIMSCFLDGSDVKDFRPKVWLHHKLVYVG